IVLQPWINVRDIFLEEDLWHDGLMGFDPNVCSGCAGTSAFYRCKECQGGELLCQPCMVSTHKRNGLHQIEVGNTFFNGVFFEFSTLKSLGFRFQLGHKLGAVCPDPKPSTEDDFIVIHINGIHEVSVDYCGCYEREERVIQVLKYGWFPATP
ncbi:hypothetical protein BDN72DRAFT_741027, partial [Pluteus cervinus]